MIQDAFFQLGILVVLATACGLFASRLKQPLIPAYILAGVLLGPVLGVITDSTLINTLSLWGIAFFLFLIGLEMDIKKVASVGAVITVGGTLQVVLTAALSFALLLAWFGKLEAAYLAFAVSLSSTMVVVKLLSDRKEIDTLHGRIAVGVLLMQDILAIIGLAVLSTFNGNTGVSIPQILVTVGALALCVFLTGQYLFPPLFRFAARNTQLLFLLAISACLLFALAFQAAGLSMAIGAFLAGLSLSGLPYNAEIVGRIKPLRDFFSTLFFTSLGLSLALSTGGMLSALLVLIALTVILKPLLLFALCVLFGYVPRTAFLTGLSLAQISEFSLIVVALGKSLGHLSAETYTLMVLLAMVTIATTSYSMHFEHALYRLVAPLLRLLPASRTAHLQYLPRNDAAPELLLVGYDRIGYNVLKTIQKMRKSFLVIDYNPDTIRELIAKRIPCLYGDISDPEILDRVNLRQVKLAISTIVTEPENAYLIRRVKAASAHAVVFSAAATVDDALQLYRTGSDYVILPHFLGGEYASVLLEQLGDIQGIVRRKLDHIADLRNRRQLGHEHPHA